MTDLLPVAPDALSLEVDPVDYMATVLHRAKSWLEEAQSIDDVRNAKAISVGYESVIREKELGMDAQLAATEIVRRCERRVGELIRKGQEEGLIRTTGSDTRVDLPDHVADGVRGLAEVAGVKNRSSVQPLYRMAEATPEAFDAAIAEAKAEGNLSRTNVVRKVKGESLPEPRSEWHHNKRRIDSDRIVTVLMEQMDAMTTGLDLIDPDALDVELKVQAISSIQQSIRLIQKEMKKW